MQIFYINLDRDTDRRASMEAQLARLGLSASRVPAFTPADVPADLIARYCNEQQGRFVSPEELACTLSHRAAWQAMIGAGLPYALFIEDDVLLSPRLPQFLKAAPALIEGLDLLRVETNQPTVRLGRRTSMGTDGISLHTVRSYVFGMSAYVLKPGAAEKLMGPLQHLELPIDYAVYSRHYEISRTLAIRQTVPAFAANGWMMEQLTGRTHPSNLEAARNNRRAIRIRSESERPPGFWDVGWRKTLHDGYLAAREAVVRPVLEWVLDGIRGIRRMRIPLA